MRILPPPTNLIDFSSNDYLGLARSAALAGRIQTAIGTNPVHGSTGSRLLSGNQPEAIETEAFLAERWGVESVLVFSSGYMANLGLLSSIQDRHATILYDQLAHACIKDGARLSQGRRFSFHHNDLDHLEYRLKQSDGVCYVAVESVYSMDGDRAPLNELCELCDSYGARLVVDEAHATAVEGKQGGGLTETLGLSNRIFARINTFGKAMGLHGASVSGPSWLKDHLVNHSRPFIYTTAPPPALFQQIRVAFQYIDQHPELVAALYDRIRYFRTTWDSLLGERFGLLPSGYPIQAWVIPGEKEVRAMAAFLQDRGFDLRPILPPTIRPGSERIRICIHAHNTEEEIRGLISSISESAVEE